MVPAAPMLSEHKTLSATISLYDKLVGDANLNQSPLQKRRKKGKSTVLQKCTNYEPNDLKPLIIC